MIRIVFSLVLFLLNASVPYAQTIAGEPQLRDIKPPVDIAGGNWLLYFLFAIVFLILLAIAGYTYLMRSKQVDKEFVFIPSWDIALKQLEELQGKQYVEKCEFKEYYFELGLILRHYFENRFSVKAPDMTTDEFLASLKQSTYLTDQQKNMLEEFFTFSDMVKFAKHTPTVNDAKQGYDLVCGLIDVTKERNSQEIK